MGLVTRYNTKEDIPEELRDEFVEDAGISNEKLKGTWVLKDIYALEKSIRQERNEHLATKNTAEAEKAMKAKLAEDLARFQSLGDPDTLQKAIELAKKNMPIPKLEDLQKDLETKTNELRALQAWKKEKEPEYNSLKENYEKMVRKADLSDAESAIRNHVKSMKGVFGDALANSLIMAYRAGELVRSNANEIVAKDGTPLMDFAPEFAKANSLNQPSIPSGGTPPEAPAAPLSKTALQKSLDEAKARGDTDTVQKIKIQLYSQEEK